MYPEQPVDPNQIMEDTQVVDWDAEEEEEETERSSNSLGYSLEPIGRLLVFGGTHGPQKDCPLYIGNNVIGRSPDCSVVLPFPSISKRHAMIEIPAWNKAALLQDCGSLNGTRIMRPPKILTSGINHCLRNKDLILLADLPCQYYRLNIPLPLVSRIPLTIEETPRVQGGTQPSRILLAEDSEEEVDFLSERCVVNEPRTTSSPLTTVVPESDEEGLSAAPGVPGPSFVAFDLVSDTDEEEDQPPEAGEASSAAREGTVVEAEQPDEMTSGIQQVKVRATVQRYKNRKVKTDAGSDVVPLGVIRERSHLPREDSDTDMDEERNPPGRRPARAHLERAQPSGIVDSDTDAEEEGIPVTPAVVPVKKRQILCGVGKKGRRAPGLARLTERSAGRDTSVEEGKAPLAGPLERGPTSVVTNSDADDDEEVSAALALAHLKESGAILWPRGKAVEEDRAQSQTASGRNSNTGMKEEFTGGKRETIPTDKDRVLVTHSEKGQPLLGDNDSDPEDVCLPATQCFVKIEPQSPETVQTLEDEPTQAFPLTLPQEPGPTHCSLPTQGVLDVPWEVFSTQPFYLREFEISEPQPIATSLETHGSCSPTVRALPHYQHLVHTEPLGTQGRETVEKDMGHLNSKTPPAESASRVTRSRTNRSSVKTSEPVVSMGPEIQPPTYIDQPVSPEPMSWASRGRAHKSSVMTPKPIIPMIPELQPLMSREESVTPKPRSRATRSRTCKKSSTKTPESGGRTPPELEPSASTNQPVIPEATDQNKTLRSSTLSATLVPIIPELQTPAATAQPAPLEPRNSKRKRAARKQGSHVAPIGQRPSSVTPEPESQSSNQRSGVLSAAESRGTIPEPALHQLPEAHTHAPLTQNVEEAGRSGVILEPKPETSQICKRTSTTMASSLLQKRPRRGVSQKIALSSGGDDSATRLVKEEDVVVPEPDKSRRDQAEEGPKANPSRNLRRNKPNQEPAAPKVLFTGVVDARGERAVLALGGSLATSVNEASHLVTDRIRRTVKFLCALGKGIPILSLDWLYQSRKAGCFLPPDEYLVTDPEQEKNFSFSLRDALTRAQERKLLEGYEIHVTAGVQPTPPQMGEIINCCGGTVLTSMPRSYKPHRVVVTCPQDIPRCSIPSRLGLPLVSPEFLLTGVLKQEATPEAFLLSNLQSHPPENSSTFTTQRNCRK